MVSFIFVSSSCHALVSIAHGAFNTLLDSSLCAFRLNCELSLVKAQQDCARLA